MDKGRIKMRERCFDRGNSECKDPEEETNLTCGKPGKTPAGAGRRTAMEEGDLRRVGRATQHRGAELLSRMGSSRRDESSGVTRQICF